MEQTHPTPALESDRHEAFLEHIWCCYHLLELQSPFSMTVSAKYALLPFSGTPCSYLRSTKMAEYVHTNDILYFQSKLTFKTA